MFVKVFAVPVLAILNRFSAGVTTASPSYMLGKLKSTNKKKLFAYIHDTIHDTNRVKQELVKRNLKRNMPF